ncbi:hypothetical protein Tco_1573055 [Tanacetum coccineum]
MCFNTREYLVVFYYLKAMNSLPDYMALDECHQRIQQIVFTEVDLLVQEKVVHVFNIVLVPIFEVRLRKAIRFVMRSLGWLLEEIHVTWAQLEKKRTRPRLYTNYLEENLTNCGDGVTSLKRWRDGFLDGFRM